MAISKVHFSSLTCEWATPQGIYEKLNREFRFTLDPCATAENAKCDRYFTIADDGLAQRWSPESVFMNPPYGREIGKWVRKAYEESMGGATVVCLIPSRTDTSYWHKYVMRSKDIRFLCGRLCFHDSGQRAPFPSVVVVFWPPNRAPKSENEYSLWEETP